MQKLNIVFGEQWLVLFWLEQKVFCIERMGKMATGQTVDFECQIQKFGICPLGQWK